MAVEPARPAGAEAAHQTQAPKSQNATVREPDTLTRIGRSNTAWPLHNTSSSQALEQAALWALSGHGGSAPSLMARAGWAVARLAIALTPHAQRIHIFAGPGNNGGDGLVAARHLHQLGKAVTVWLLAEGRTPPADAAQALRDALTAGVTVHDSLPCNIDDKPCDMAIDALLGLGASRAPTGGLAQAISLMNTVHAAGLPVLAVDLPSGLCADTGTAWGDAVVHASATLCLLTLKPGCFTGRGRDACGSVWLDRLGVAPSAPTAWLAGRSSAPSRSAHDSHKGSFGDVIVVGGAAGMVGAAWLAARAALAVGAGRVHCCLLDPQSGLIDPQQPELMGRPTAWLSNALTLEKTTVVCGCGGGDAVQAVLPALLSRAARLVLDADALNAVSADPGLQTLLRQRAHKGLPSVLTPHPLEAARLLQTSTAQVQADRLKAALAVADQFKVTVVLKGSGTVVASPGEPPRITPNGNAALATAGTGDVLAGCLGGWWAQCADVMRAAAPRADLTAELTRMAAPNPSNSAASPLTDLVSAAVWWHADAADTWQAAGHLGPLRASDLVQSLATRR
jgi:ADP-dependent NAD(P)H-hydrate dehydratase / NAD(P)H-hydrate epimerase